MGDLNWALYDRIVKERVSETWYNMKITGQAHEQATTAHKAALKEEDAWEKAKEEKFKEVERRQNGLTETN